MNVSELMTTEVVTAAPDESLRDVARRLVEHGISGVPVCDDDWNVVGVLSEGDILYKERGSVERRGRLARLVDTQLAEITKAQARTVADGMTAPAFTITPSTTVARAARLMLDKGVNRLPVVVHDGQLVGIVTRTDLVRAFARPDAEIAAEIRNDILRHVFWVQPESIGVVVHDGEVRLAGDLETTTEAKALESLVGTVPGVISVRSTVTGRTAPPGGSR